MELRDFVGNALVQIIQGVKDAQQKVSEDGALVNPRIVEVRGRGDQQGGLIANNGEPIRDVQFDIVATVSEGVGVEEHIDVSSLGSLEIVVGGEQAVPSNAVNRIRFRVPVSLPPQSQ
jgi:hypothetical protein